MIFFLTLKLDPHPHHFFSGEIFSSVLDLSVLDVENSVFEYPMTFIKNYLGKEFSTFYFSKRKVTFMENFLNHELPKLFKNLEPNLFCPK